MQIVADDWPEIGASEMAKTAADEIREIKAKAEAEAAKLADEAKTEVDTKWDEVDS